ncbi:hypothetical protein C8R45DRAFT_991105 [Mycena sanguinolenta]|nr:hypothetical protein C8R45DRAFT_991105 [Mycena sanguinolenta]
MFAHCSHVQITGGNFMTAARDINFESAQAAQIVHGALPALEFGPGQNSGRISGRAERTEREGGPRMLPYDISHRRRISAHPDNPDTRSSGPTTASYFSCPPYDQGPQLQPYQHPLSDGPSNESWGQGSDPVSVANGRVINWCPDVEPIPSGPGVGAPPSLISAPAPSSQNPGPSFPWNHPPTTSITGGTFIGRNVNHGEAGLHILRRAIAGGAFHDSAERYPQPQCHPDTRTQLLEVLSKWTCGIEPPRIWTRSTLSENDQPSGRILWLHGPAGSGKSAVAQSLCQKLKEEGRLGGSFFFKRGHPSRGNAKRLFPTIAYQLALLLPELKQHISRAIENDPAIVDRSLSTQLQELILDPCWKTCISRPLCIIIDGLDECDGEEVQHAVLQAIAGALRQEDLPILFLVASRPEAHIRETFAESGLAGYHRPMNIEQSFDDVRKYLHAEFDRIHHQHQTMTAVPLPWPQPEIVEQIVRNSSGYFIYASTVIKFIDDKRFQPPDRLDVMLGIRHSISRSPFNPLDQLYLQILSGVPEDFHRQLLRILVFLNKGVFLKQTGDLLELQTSELRLILRGLHSVIHVPGYDWENVSAHHASFLDFFNDPSRSGPFHVGSPYCRTDLAVQLLKTLSRPFDPSPDLLPLVQSMNADFVFLSDRKKPTFTPPPQRLIDIWEDYAFMSVCEDLCYQEAGDFLDSTERPSSPAIVSQVSLDINTLRVLYACIVTAITPNVGWDCLFKIRNLLGLSWDELRAAISPLRRIFGRDTVQLTNHRTWIVDETGLATLDTSSVLAELAKSSLFHIGGSFYEPVLLHPNLLLNDLSEFARVSDSEIGTWDTLEDFYNVVQWLKVTLCFSLLLLV